MHVSIWSSNIFKAVFTVGLIKHNIVSVKDKEYVKIKFDSKSEGLFNEIMKMQTQ